MIHNNGQARASGLAWAAFILALLALILAWVAFNRSGQDLEQLIQQEVSEATQEIREEYQEAEREVRQESEENLLEGAADVSVDGDPNNVGE